jgi:hypothetical protein
MSNVIYETGTQSISVPAGAKIAIATKGKCKVYQVFDYVNQPSQNIFLVEINNGRYTSSAFTAATTIIIDSFASANVFYEVGTDAVVLDTMYTAYQAAPVALNATGALTAAAILGGIVTSTTAAAVAGTLPTGTVLDLATSLTIGQSFDWAVINTGPNTFTVTAATGHTIVGAAAVATATSAEYRTLKTAANTFVSYRVS